MTNYHFPSRLNGSQIHFPVPPLQELMVLIQPSDLLIRELHPWSKLAVEKIHEPVGNIHLLKRGRPSLDRHPKRQLRRASHLEFDRLGPEFPGALAGASASLPWKAPESRRIQTLEGFFGLRNPAADRSAAPAGRYIPRTWLRFRW